MRDNRYSVQAAAVSWKTQPPARVASLDLLAPVATIKRCRSGEEICSQEGAVDFWYGIVSGLARRYTVRPSGRRQIVGLLLPGELFGFPVRDENSAFAVEAVIGGTIVACYPRPRLEALADSDPRVARLIRERAFEAIARLEEQVFILGRTTALKKVGSFLLKMEESFSAVAGDRLVLPMTRYDIADYLGLSVETVSRAMTDLKQRGAIHISGARCVTIVDRDALETGESDGSMPMQPTAAGSVGGARVDARPARSADDARASAP